jgi:hypothetical protein
MSKLSDLEVVRDIARATAARFVRKAAGHVMRAMDPDYRKDEFPLAIEARSQAQKWAAKADEVSAELKKRVGRKSNSTSEKTIGSR